MKHHDMTEEYVFHDGENLEEKDHQSEVRAWRRNEVHGMENVVQRRKELVRKVLGDKEKGLFLHNMVIQWSDDEKALQNFPLLYKSLG